MATTVEAIGVGAGRGGPAVDQAELDRRVVEHGRWLATDGDEGRRLALAGADLRDLDLKGEDLRDADFQGADLRGADLRDTRLKGALLRDANLQDADLTGARNVLDSQLGGAHLAGAKLPDALQKFEGLAGVGEASRTSQNLFATLLFVCAYTCLTVASTADTQLLNRAAPSSSRLPILGTDIPLFRFYLVAPLLLLALYVYFHLCLQRFWEELADLPAAFPDGRTLDKKAYPWLLNSLVGSNMPRLREGQTFLAAWQTRISVLLGWGVVPLTLTFVWARYLRGHDWQVSAIHVALLATSIGAAAGFLKLAGATLSGAEHRASSWRVAWHDARIVSVLVTLGCGGLLFVLTYGAIDGINPRLVERDLVEAVPAPATRFDPRAWVPRLFATVGYNPFANLDDVDVSTKPASWTGKAENTTELDAVKGADLEGRNLCYADAYGAFLAKGFFKRAQLRGADLREADLRGADLRGADLRGANLRWANLDEADLRGANLGLIRARDTEFEKARLNDADLKGADLRGSKLDGAELAGADLQGARFDGATLAGADLAGADLTGAIGLVPDQLRGVTLSATTRLPSGFGPGLVRAQSPDPLVPAIATDEPPALRPPD